MRFMLGCAVKAVTVIINRYGLVFRQKSRESVNISLTLFLRVGVEVLKQL